MKKRTFILTLAILSVLPRFLGQAQETGQSLSREKSLAILRCCGHTPCSDRCDENAAEYLINLFSRGDRALLTPLIDAGLVSDGALSETLGQFYGELLRSEPHTFLRALVSRPRTDQRDLARLAASLDGSGMPNGMLREVRAKLRKIGAQKNRLAPIARLTLAEVNRANQIEK